MSDQYLSFKDARLSAVDLIDFDHDTTDDADVRWFEYCRIAATLNRRYILGCMLSNLDAEDSPLFELIDDAIANPHEPGRPKANITDLARVGKAILGFQEQSPENLREARSACDLRSEPHLKTSTRWGLLMRRVVASPSSHAASCFYLLIFADKNRYNHQQEFRSDPTYRKLSGDCSWNPMT